VVGTTPTTSFKEYWKPSEDEPEERIYPETFAGDVFNDEYEALRATLREGPNAKLEPFIAGIIFYSDATHLTSFGTASLYPMYICMLVTSLSILAQNHRNLRLITLLIFQRYFKTLPSLLCLTESKARRRDPRVLPGNFWKGRHGWHSRPFAVWASSRHLASLARWRPNAPVYRRRSHKTFRSNYASYVPSFFILFSGLSWKVSWRLLSCYSCWHFL